MKRNEIYLFYFLIIIILKSIQIEASPKISVELGSSLLYNGYFGNFNGFPNYDCCGHFTKGKGLGFDISTTGVFRSIYSTNLFNLNYFTTAAVRNLSGKFEYEEYFADVIYNEKVYKAISRHTLETEIFTFSFTQGLDLDNLFKLKPLSFRFGTSLNIPFKHNFHQKEELIAPEQAYFENKQKTRNVFEGEINNFRNPLFGLFFNIGLKIFLVGNSYIKPNLYFDVPLSTLAKNVNLNTFHLSLGISVGYNIPGTMPKPTIEPPPPDFPEPIKPKGLRPLLATINIKIKPGNQGLKNGDTLFLKRNLRHSVEITPTPTIIFFPKNDFLFGEDSIPITQQSQMYYEENRKILGIVKEYLKKNPNRKITLVCSQTSDELPNICDLRIARLVEYFRSQGLGDFIENTSQSVASIKKPLPELQEEERNIQIVFSDGMYLFDRETTVKIDTSMQIPTLDVQIKTATDSKYKTKVLINSQNKSIVFSENEFELDLSNFEQISYSNFDSLLIKAQIQTEDDLPQVVNDSLKIYVKIIELNSTDVTYHNPINGKNNMLAGLFKFDQSEPYWVNPKLQTIVSEILSRGKKIAVLGSVDNLGSEDHNKKLATERAKRIRTILNIDLPIKTIEINSRSRNQSPFERLLHRSAWISFE